MKPHRRAPVRIRIREPHACCCEPTLDEILSDSIVDAVMRADAVDRRELGAMLGQIAQTLRAATPSGKRQLEERLQLGRKFGAALDRRR